MARQYQLGMYTGMRPHRWAAYCTLTRVWYFSYVTGKRAAAKLVNQLNAGVQS